MANTENKKQTLGNFNVTGFITVDDKTFELNKEGKNNKNWIMNVFNPKVETKNGQSMYMRFMDGFDKVKGKTIYARIKDSKDNIEVSFADRSNETILEQIDDMSFIKIGLNKEKVKDEETGKEFEQWNYKKFLTAYDAIAFLKERLQIGNTYKLRLRGGQSFNLYQGNTNRNYNLQTIYILDAKTDTSPCELSFNHNLLIDSSSTDLSKWEDEGVINVLAKVYQKKKKDQYEVLEIPFKIKEIEGKKDVIERMVNRLLIIKDDTIRRINMVGYYNSGYVNGNVEENDLPDEVKDLIKDGVYTKEDILNMNVGRERVDEMILVKPRLKRINGVPHVDKDDEEFTADDIMNLIIKSDDEIEEIEISQEEEVTDDLLDELENL